MRTERGRNPRQRDKITCGVCFEVVLRDQTSQTDTGKWVCREHLKGGRRKAPPKPDKLFYVLQVEPGRESRVRADLLRRAKVKALDHLVGRVFSPTGFGEVTVQPKRPTLAEGTHTEWKAAREEATLQANKLDPDGTLGLKVSVFLEYERAKPLIRWKVRGQPVGEPTVKTLRVKKYPGYMICQLAWSDALFSLVSGLKDSFGLLLQPVVRGLRVDVSVTKLSGWVYKVKSPESGEVLDRGKNFPTREQARAAGRQRADELGAFRPTALETEEAAELLISQRAVNQIGRDKTEMTRAVLQYREGSPVTVTDGAFKGLDGVVVEIDRADPADPRVRVEVVIIGVRTPILVKWFEVKKRED